MQQIRPIFLGLILCFSFQLTLSAQTKLGIKAGVAFPQSEKETLTLQHPLDAYHHDLTLNETPFGLRAGLFLRAPVGKILYIQPEVIFSLQRNIYNLRDLRSDKSETYEERTQYIDVPLGLGLKFGALRLHGGASAHYLLSQNSELTNALPEYTTTNDDLSFNWMAGIGLDLWNVTLDARYDQPLNSSGSSFLIGEDPFQFQKPIARILVSMGVVF